jgi:neutral ceramidase
VSGRLLAGVARASINPPLGIRTMGFSSRVGFVESVASDLTVTSLVLANDQTRLAIVALDICLLPIARADVLRRRVGEAIGAPPANVLVNFSHTHSAPAFPDWQPEPPDQLRLQEQYWELLAERTVQSAAQARELLQPARVAAGWGESRIGVNRREMGPDGLIFLGEVPDGETDPAVGVVRVDDLNGQPIAVLCSLGCHTVVVGPRDHAASPDFPGPARKVVESTLGGLTLFLQACGGDVMPVGGMGYETDCSDANERVGTMLAGEVLKVAAGLRTHLRRGERTALGSVSAISLWPWVPVEDDGSQARLAARSERIWLDFIDLPTLEDAQAILDEKRRLLVAARATGDERQIAPATRFVTWAEALVDACETNRRTIDFEVQALLIDELALVGLSAEAFSGTGIEIKARSPIANTNVLGYSNGCVMYLPRAQDYPPGGWDVHVRYKIPDMLFQNYLVPVAFHPDSEQRVVETALKLLNELV